MTNSITCIGHMGRGRYAELNFDGAEAVVVDRTPNGRVEVASVPIGVYYAETDERCAQLMPQDPQNRALAEIVGAPDFVAALREIVRVLGARFGDGLCDVEAKNVTDEEMQRWIDEDYDLLYAARDALVWAEVPTD
ncbi:MAG: hypothetical protein GC159_17530 [Phycisphaera sp.]|nr:hypothetical protein [Phycisphaera sp.]